MSEAKKNVSTESKKSGLRRLKPGEVLFEDGEQANSLFIIQKGQLRLYKPKGKGFIEIAVLRAGEVIGEMAYFESGAKLRSCAAAAMVSCDIIEISFSAFEKTMSGLNPWFKTIIITLANRLRTTNSRVKELESNSTASYGDGSYEFLKSSDVIKILGTLFLVFKSHGEIHEDGSACHKKTILLYAKDTYGIQESKLESIMFLLKELGHVSIHQDEAGENNLYVLETINFLRSLFIFYNSQRYLRDSQKMSISQKCQTFLERIYNDFHDDPEPLLKPFSVEYILMDFNHRNMKIGIPDLNDAKNAGITGELISEEEELFIELNSAKLFQLIPIIQFINKLNELNQSKK